MDSGGNKSTFESRGAAPKHMNANAAEQSNDNYEAKHMRREAAQQQIGRRALAATQLVDQAPRQGRSGEASRRSYDDEHDLIVEHAPQSQVDRDRHSGYLPSQIAAGEPPMRSRGELDRHARRSEREARREARRTARAERRERRATARAERRGERVQTREALANYYSGEMYQPRSLAEVYGLEQREREAALDSKLPSSEATDSAIKIVRSGEGQVKLSGSQIPFLNNRLGRDLATGKISTADAQSIHNQVAPDDQLFRNITDPRDGVRKAYETAKEVDAELTPTIDPDRVKSANQQAAAEAEPTDVPRGPVDDSRAEYLGGRFGKYPSYDKVISLRDQIRDDEDQHEVGAARSQAELERQREFIEARRDLAAEVGRNIPKDASEADKDAVVAEFNELTDTHNQSVMSATSFWNAAREVDIQQRTEQMERAERRHPWRRLRERFAALGRERDTATGERRERLSGFRRSAATTVIAGIALVAALKFSGTTSEAMAGRPDLSAESTTATETDNSRSLRGDALDSLMKGGGEIQGEAMDKAAASENEKSGDQLEARTYDAENLPAADYHMWSVAGKRTEGSFTAGMKNPADRVSAYNHMMEACESTPEQAAIFGSQLFTEDELRDMGVEGDDINSIADMLQIDDGLRAEWLTKVSSKLAGGTWTMSTLHGNYTDYGIIKTRDGGSGGYRLINGEYSVEGRTAIIIEDGESKNTIVVLSDCDNVVEQANHATTPQERESARSSAGGSVAQTGRGGGTAPAQPASHPTGTSIHTGGRTTTIVTGGGDTSTGDNGGGTPEQPGQGGNDTTSTGDKDKETPKDDELQPKVLSEVNKGNASTGVKVNDAPGGVDNPTGRTDHTPRSDEGGSAESGGGAASSSAGSAASGTTGGTTSGQGAGQGQGASIPEGSTTSVPASTGGGVGTAPQQTVSAVHQQEQAAGGGATVNATASGGQSSPDAVASADTGAGVDSRSGADAQSSAEAATGSIDMNE